MNFKDKPSQAGETMDDEDAAVAKLLLALGFQQRRIAGLFDVNQGRISEIETGHRFGEVKSLKLAAGISVKVAP